MVPDSVESSYIELFCNESNVHWGRPSGSIKYIMALRVETVSYDSLRFTLLVGSETGAHFLFTGCWTCIYEWKRSFLWSWQVPGLHFCPTLKSQGHYCKIQLQSKDIICEKLFAHPIINLIKARNQTHFIKRNQTAVWRPTIVSSLEMWVRERVLMLERTFSRSQGSL